VRTLPNTESQAKSLWKKHGLWGVKFLLEELVSPDPLRDIPADELLLAIGTPALPHLIRALESDNPSLQETASILLYRWPYHPEDREWTQEWLDTLERVSRNEHTTAAVRGNALLTSRRLTDSLRLALVERLGSSDAEDRRRGEKELRTRGPEFIPELHRFQRQHPESKAQVDSICKEILKREVDTLSGKGNLEEALLRLAESEGVGDPAAFVKEKLEAVEKDICLLYTPPATGSGPGPDSTGLARKLWSKHGLWGLEVLLEGLATPRETAYDTRPGSPGSSRGTGLAAAP
jgi:hypothetical protein